MLSFAACYAARITDEEEQAVRIRKHTSARSLVVAVDSNLGAVVGEKEGAVMSSPEKRRKNCPGMGACSRSDGRECLQHTSEHMEGWTPRNEAITGSGADKSLGPQKHP